ncbi:hypothetical protein GCM10017562_03580 [Streptomyces roseofulvus]|uniref:DUF6223 family protein n=1 Tax=Streptomyces roseofulvus TaxID=33902 RepID=UPI0031F93A2F
MSVRHVLAVGAGTVLGRFGFAEPGATRASVEPLAADAYELTAGRLVGTAAALVALVGVVVGALALTRSARRIGDGRGKRGALVSLVAGLLGIVVGVVNLAVADGGPGTGNGVLGGALAVLFGVVAAVLGRLALVRSRRAGPTGPTRPTGRPADRPDERAFE